MLISLIVFTDKYLGHVRTFYTNGFSLHSNYIQIPHFSEGGVQIIFLKKSKNAIGIGGF